MLNERQLGSQAVSAPGSEATKTNQTVLVAFAFTRLILSIIIFGSVALSGFSTASSDSLLLTTIFLAVAAIGFIYAAQMLATHYRKKTLTVESPWIPILLDSALAIGVMAMIDAETSPLAWVALIAPVLETAVLLTMARAAFVWVGLSLAFLALRLSLGVSDDAGVETLTLAIQQVLAVLLVSGPLALLSDSAQQRIDKLSDARRSADQIADRLRRIAQAASDMSKENSIESVLTSVSHSAITIGFDHADVVIMAADGTLSSHSNHSTGPFSIPPLEILTPDATDTNLATIIAGENSTNEHAQFLHTHEVVSGHAIRISSNSGSDGSSAVLRVWSKRRPSTEHERRALSLLAGHAREIHHAAMLLADAKAHSEQLLYEVRHDALTGMANRAYVLSTLEERIAAKDQIALFFLDLDGFKEINDTLGHRAGDAALVSVAERLRSLTRQGSLAGRMGGDEFIVILPITGAETPERLQAYGRGIVAAISQPMVVDGHNAQLGASVGLAIHAPGIDADQLISLADGAMYEAKRGQGGLKVADASISALNSLTGTVS